MVRHVRRIAVLGAAVAAIGVTVPAGAFARHGADDPVGHVRKARGADDGAAHVRSARGADDPVGHVRRSRGADDVPVTSPAASAAAPVAVATADDHGGRGRGRGGDDGPNHT